MVKLMEKFAWLGTLVGLSVAVDAAIVARAADPCAAIGGQKWVFPKAVRDCYNAVPVNETLKANILDVVSKSLNFHTSVNYQIRAPEPFTQDVHEDLFKDLARINATKYTHDYDMHIDLSRTLKRLNDGHCVWINSCYVSFFINYLPTPLALLTDSRGNQAVHIAPEAFTVASAEFPDQIDFWQNALPGKLKGQLASLSGARVLTINGKDPNVAIDANAQITGSFQGLGTRQNTYQASGSTWTYLMGNFAQQSLPLDDQVVLQIQRNGSSSIDTITLSYRSRLNSASNFTDLATFLSSHCFAQPGTNGVDLNAPTAAAKRLSPAEKPVARFQQQPAISAEDARKQHLNVMLDALTPSDVVLPPGLTPPAPVNGSRNAAQFFLLDDKKTGVLALGSFSDNDFNAFQDSLLQGLLNLKSLGAAQLVVDVSNNGGGFICAAHVNILSEDHHNIVGPKSTSVPQAGLNTTARDGILARKIVQQIITKNLDPNLQLLYNPRQWRGANENFFAADDNWLLPPVNKTINGHQDAFSQLLGQECQPEGFPSTPPGEALFDPTKVVIVSITITMAKEEGAKTVVLGGRKSVKQEYCGTIQTTQLKNDPLAPPDLLINGVQGIAWRLGFGINDPTQPEEWQDHPADVNLPLTEKIVNNPIEIWKTVAAMLL
ncbi:hypothetical protein AN958_02439 [Leucoagaricus sp. SymC.cos]|nr:hypothetical protein AN958_02439 [Leucoagaricus sp. SymC.cos]